MCVSPRPELAAMGRSYIDCSDLGCSYIGRRTSASFQLRALRLNTKTTGCPASFWMVAVKRDGDS